MTTIVELDYRDNEIYEMADWLRNNVGEYKQQSGPTFYGETWMLYHTTIHGQPHGNSYRLPYAITRAAFTYEDDAVMFKLRWA